MLAGDVLIGTYTLEVTAVNLYTWLVGKHLHQDTCLGAVEAGANLCVVALTVLEGVQAVVVVVTCSVLNLVELRVDAVAQSVWLTEVHWSALNRLDLACGDIKLVAWSKVISVYIQYHVVSGLCKVAAKVVVVVVGLVNDSWLVGLSLPSHIQHIVGCKLVGGNSHYLAGESVFAISSYDGKLQD